jgi:hypothetical protein
MKRRKLMSRNATMEALGWLTGKAWMGVQEWMVLWVAVWIVLIEGRKLSLVFHPAGRNTGIPGISFWKGVSEDRHRREIE